MDCLLLLEHLPLHVSTLSRFLLLSGLAFHEESVGSLEAKVFNGIQYMQIYADLHLRQSGKTKKTATKLCQVTIISRKVLSCSLLCWRSVSTYASRSWQDIIVSCMDCFSSFAKSFSRSAASQKDKCWTINNWCWKENERKSLANIETGIWSACQYLMLYLWIHFTKCFLDSRKTGCATASCLL